MVRQAKRSHTYENSTTQISDNMNHFTPGIFTLSLLLFAVLFLISCKKNNDNNPTITPLTATDIQGNVYKTIVIGSQIWMAENLKVTKFNDGTPIPMVVHDTGWVYRTTPAYCWINNDSVGYCRPFGALYNWHTVMTGKLAPAGWHIPSDAEWQIMINYLGGDLTAGGRMKEADTTHWLSPNTGATNSSGFNGLPSGSREMGCTGLGESGIWWSATPYDSAFAYGRSLIYFSAIEMRNMIPKDFGLSVRCIKN
jgi:uncharacterized protein (TIGR02145 family)